MYYCVAAETLRPLSSRTLEQPQSIGFTKRNLKPTQPRTVESCAAANPTQAKITTSTTPSGITYMIPSAEALLES